MQWLILKLKLRDLGRNGLKIIQNWWRNWWRVILAIIALIIVLIILIWVGYKLDWTGFGTKTLWDWMEILIVPAVLAGGAYWLNESARKREIDIADKRAETERNIAADNRQEAALQTYLDKMTELLLDKKLYESEEDSEIRAVARARTLTVLRTLDGDRKGALLQFLYEAGLIYIDKAVIDLKGADLRGADLNWANLTRANLVGAELSYADLRVANLSDAILSYADLRGANLSDAILSRAILNNANLSGAILSYADLRGANLHQARLNGANLSWADLRETWISGNLSGVILSNAHLSGADLSWADLSEADLKEAKYTKNAKHFRDTKWPEGFDPDAAGAILIKV